MRRAVLLPHAPLRTGLFARRQRQRRGFGGFGVQEGGGEGLPLLQEGLVVVVVMVVIMVKRRQR